MAKVWHDRLFQIVLALAVLAGSALAGIVIVGLSHAATWTELQAWIIVTGLVTSMFLTWAAAMVGLAAHADKGTNRESEPPRTPNALEEWRHDLTRRPQRTEAVETRGGAARAAAAADEAFARRLREKQAIARALAESPPTVDDLAPYCVAADLRVLREDGHITRVAGADDAGWRQKVASVLPAPYLSEFSRKDLRSAVEYLGSVLVELEGNLPPWDRVRMLRRLVGVGETLQLRTPTKTDWLGSPGWLDTSKWITDVNAVLPHEWRAAWNEKTYKSSPSISGIAPDFDNAIAWLVKTTDALARDCPDRSAS